MRAHTSWLCIFVVLTSLYSCRTSHNTAGKRQIYAFKTRYNAYYNAEKTFLNTFGELTGRLDSISPEYIRGITVPLVTDRTGLSFDPVIEKCHSMIRTYSIDKKPKRKAGWRKDPVQRAIQAKKEYNPVLHKCWKLLALSHFHNGDTGLALDVWNYMEELFFDDPELTTEIHLQKARCFMRMQEPFRAFLWLDKYNLLTLPAHEKTLYAYSLANYYLHTNNKHEALPSLHQIIRTEKDRHFKKQIRQLIKIIDLEPTVIPELYATAAEETTADYPSFDDFIRSTNFHSLDHYKKLTPVPGSLRSISEPAGTENILFSSRTDVPFFVMILFPENVPDKNRFFFETARFHLSGLKTKHINIENAGEWILISEFNHLTEYTLYYAWLIAQSNLPDTLRHTRFIPISTVNYDIVKRHRLLGEYIHFYETNSEEWKKINSV